MPEAWTNPARSSIAHKGPRAVRDMAGLSGRKDTGSRWPNKTAAQSVTEPREYLEFVGRSDRLLSCFQQKRDAHAPLLLIPGPDVTAPPHGPGQSGLAAGLMRCCRLRVVIHRAPGAFIVPIGEVVGEVSNKSIESVTIRGRDDESGGKGFRGDLYGVGTCVLVMPVISVDAQLRSGSMSANTISVTKADVPECHRHGYRISARDDDYRLRDRAGDHYEVARTTENRVERLVPLDAGSRQEDR